MADGPICPKCNGPRTPQKNGKGGWYLGCANCNKKDAKPDDQKPPEKKPDEKKKDDGGSWADAFQ